MNLKGNILRSRSGFPFENSAGNTLELMDMGSDFLNRTQMAQQLRERIDKCDYTKLRSFYTTKEVVTILKRQLTEWEKIFVATHLTRG
jgi:hypothetical protein